VWEIADAIWTEAQLDPIETRRRFVELASLRWRERPARVNK
jgi:hypothetical protein